VPKTVYASAYALRYTSTLLTQEKFVSSCAVGARLKLQSSGLTGSGIAACVQPSSANSGTMHTRWPATHSAATKANGLNLQIGSTGLLHRCLMHNLICGYRLYAWYQ
jgi:hypothetical protein